MMEDVQKIVLAGAESVAKFLLSSSDVSVLSILSSKCMLQSMSIQNAEESFKWVKLAYDGYMKCADIIDEPFSSLGRQIIGYGCVMGHVMKFGRQSYSEPLVQCTKDWVIISMHKFVSSGIYKDALHSSRQPELNDALILKEKLKFVTQVPWIKELIPEIVDWL